MQQASRTAPLSLAQQRLWVLDRLEPGSTAYNLRVAYRIEGRLREALLRRALGEVFRRHDVLRTTVVDTDEGPMQWIADEPPLEWTELELVDLGRRPPEERDEELWRRVVEESRRPFDLERGPLVRPTLYRLGDAEHVLLLVAHHIVFDGWSAGVLLDELLTLYEAFAAGRPSPLAEPTWQYADFARWQRSELAGEVLERQLAYWRRQLAGAPPALELPADRPRPRVQTHNGALCQRRLPGPLVERLEAIGRGQGATLFMTLLATFGALVGRYTGRTDLPIGSPIANRNDERVERLIGFFVNSLVLRLDLSGDPAFPDLLARVREVALDAYDHQDVPFERLVEELRPPRDLGRSPLFQIFFHLQAALMPVLERAGLRLRYAPIPTGTGRFDLSLSVLGADGGDLLLRADYNADLYDAGTMERLLAHYERLLEGVAAEPGRRPSRLPLMAAAEERRLIEWGRGGPGAPVEGAERAARGLGGAEGEGAARVDGDRGAANGEETLFRLFIARAELSPQAPAVRDGGETLTFGELRRRSGRLAAWLRELGLEAEEPVGVHLERSADTIVGILGILEAGGAWLPLEPGHPAPRLTAIVEDAGPRIVLTTGLAPDWLQTAVPSLVRVDRVGGGPDGAPAAPPETDEPSSRAAAAANEAAPLPLRPPSPGPDGLAYVLHTSGSTGRPKGVLGLHRGVVNRCRWMWREYPFAPGEVCCQKTALGFVDSVWEIFGPLLQGVPLVVIPDEDVADPRRLVERLAVEEVTRLVLVPSLLKALLDVEPRLGERLPRLALWVSSGEPLPRPLAERFHRATGGGARLLNLYGSTEVAGDSLCHEVVAGDPRPRVPIGRPIDATSVHVLDRHFAPLPIGVPGELHLGGAGLCRGYLLPRWRGADRTGAGLTAERFVPDPFGAAAEEDAPSAAPAGGRLYRTGDLARWLPGGELEVLGRADRQLKLRGHRIEPGEIESALEAGGAAREAVVVLRGDPEGRPRLVAYFVAGAESDPARLRRRLAERLPGYMVPAVLVPLAELPRTVSGKIDRGRLPEPGPLRTAPRTPPRDELERRLARLWRELLAIDEVGVDEDFFELGGHSLLAVDLLARIERQTGRRLSLARLMLAPTIEALARELRGSAEAPGRSGSLVPLRSTGCKRPFFCVPGVGGHLIHYRELVRHLDSERPFYGLQARGLEDDGAPIDRVEEMAGRYLEEVLAVDPEGPWLVGGSCFGGSVAFEMARQLDAAGRRVARLVLIESYAPQTGPVPTAAGARIRHAIRRARLLPGLRVADVLQSLRRRRRGRPPGGGSLHRAAREVVEAGLRARRGYDPAPYRGDVVLLQGDTRPAGYRFPPRMGWGELVAGELEVEPIPGFHTWIFRSPQVEVVAERLGSVLDRSGF